MNAIGGPDTQSSPVQTGDRQAAARAADTLRQLALDEQLKAHVLSTPHLAGIARRVASRYIAGSSIDEAIAMARVSLARGHQVSLEYMGESVRDAMLADAETDVFEELVRAISANNLPSTVSLDLSHIGLVVDSQQASRNASRLAAATHAAGIPMMISAEGSDRTDLVLEVYEHLADDHAHVGITLQARLHRSPRDLDRLLDLPGRIRLVKGAFHEPEAVAYPRDSPEVLSAYLRMAETITSAGHAVSLATHDDDLVTELRQRIGDAVLQGPKVEFEMLLGLGTEQLAALADAGFATREYVVFGSEWWLYVLNRMAEQPERVFDAIVDAIDAR